jgi:hypothetical protein
MAAGRTITGAARMKTDSQGGDPIPIGLALLPQSPRARGWHRFYWLTPLVFLAVWQSLRKGVAWLFSSTGGSYSYKVFFPFNLVPVEGVAQAARWGFLALSVAAGFFVWRFRRSLVRLRDRMFLPLVFAISLALFYLLNAVSYGPAEAVTHTATEVLDYPVVNRQFTDVSDLFARFNEVSPTLTGHATHHVTTHPPGPVLVCRIASELDPSGWLLSVFLVLSGAASLWPAWALLGELGLRGERRRAILLLWSILPAVVAYTMSSFEALFATLALTGLALGIRSVARGEPLTAIAAGLVLTAGGLLNYSVAVVGLGLAVGAVINNRLKKGALRALYQLLIVGATFAGAYILLYLASGFSYIGGFFIAVARENPDGFRLLSQPLDYATGLATSIGDLWWFLWPWLGALLVSGIRETLKNPVPADGWALGLVASVLLVLLSGACWVGETARIMLFMYPVLLYLIQRCGDRFWLRLGGIAALTYGADIACFFMFQTYW